MAKVILGNHSSVLVPRQDRESIRNFYCDVLGGEIMKADPERDFIRLGEDLYIAFLYGDVPDESEFLRTARSVWLEIKSDNVQDTSRKILESGLVRKLEAPYLPLNSREVLGLLADLQEPGSTFPKWQSLASLTAR